jgi:hypothetical protein
MLEDRKRAVVAGFLTRGPAFAATSLTSSDPPRPANGNKPVKEGGRRKGKKPAFDIADFRNMSPEQKKDLLSQATPEQLAALRGRVQARLLEQQTVDVEGKKMNLLELAKEVQKEQALHDVGGDEATLATVPGALRRATTPMKDLRPDAPKEQMRMHEQDALPLDRLCKGDAYSPAPGLGMRFGGRRDFTFGIYANGDAARKLLKGKWGRRNPEEVVSDQEFYDDVMSYAPHMGISLLVMPTRRLPLEQTVATFGGRMRNTLTFLSGGKLPPDDSSAIDTMASRFTVPRLSETRLIDRGQVAKDSQFLFSIGSKGQLAIEGITPAPLRDRRPVFLGTYPNPRLAPALLAQFLGPDAIDEEAKAEAGASLVFAINGFQFGSSPSKKNQYLLDETTETGFPAPVVEQVVAGPQLFQYLPTPGRSRRRLLLNGISSAGRGQQPQLEGA